MTFQQLLTCECQFSFGFVPYNRPPKMHVMFHVCKLKFYSFQTNWDLNFALNLQTIFRALNCIFFQLN
jgi:hypothetical protein